MPEMSARAGAFRSAIAAFIEARREATVKGGTDAEDVSKYDYGAWLADAARRVGQIQAVTHVLKATHPDARGSSLHAPPAALQGHTEIGTHVLGEGYAEDVVGNAAALDVFKFLKIDVEGQWLLDWMQAGDDDLRLALHDDAGTAATWMAAFGGLVRKEPLPVSHTAAKQIYWCVGEEPVDDGQYHLLQPLFSSSLAHAVHVDINDVRFGEINKAARQAFRDKTPLDGVYREYRGLVARKLGGTKPQNISQLNSERGGVNYLLASLPPRWTRQAPKLFLRVESAFERFGYFEGVREQVAALVELLKSNADVASTMKIRQARERIEQDLGASVAAFGLENIQRFERGWTRDPDCQLPLCEQLWLDPERTELASRPEHLEDDETFKAAFIFCDWPDEVAGRFANWVNAQLREAGLTAVGDAEYKHWATQAIVDVAWPIALQRRAGGQA